MTLRDDHPGGVITCDAAGCTATRRNYCPLAERDEWVAFQDGNAVLDLCPTHRGDRRSVPPWLTEPAPDSPAAWPAHRHPIAHDDKEQP